MSLSSTWSISEGDLRYEPKRTEKEIRLNTIQRIFDDIESIELDIRVFIKKNDWSTYRLEMYKNWLDGAESMKSILALEEKELSQLKEEG